MSRLVLRASHFLCLLIFCVGHATTSVAQGYLSATGSPSFSVNIPIPNGYINVANGNLHLEIPLASPKQRGNLQLNEKLVYDSRIWEIIHYSGYYWWPLNVPNSSVGWRFVKGNETGSVAYNLVTSSDNQCYDQYGNPGDQYTWQYAIVWTDPGGTQHTFDGEMQEYQDTCANTDSQQIFGGYATDASGYKVQDDGTGNPLVVDPHGTEVNPSVIDRFGNYWSTDSNGNLIDDLGKLPLIASQNGSQTYYDVLAPNGPIQNNGTRVRYTVTMENIPISTEFNQSGVTEYQNNGGNNPSSVPAIETIQLPDGTSYGFSYDSYGEISAMSLPTGGTVTFNWTNYTDSYQNVNRWLTSSVLDGNTTSYTPAVVTQCSQNGTGCQEQVNVHRPSNDETVYTFTLNNGAWDTATTIYQGPAVYNQPKFTDSSTYDFTHSCTYTQICGGAQYITKASDVQTLPDAALSSQTQTQYSNPESGQLTTLSKWDYYTTGSTPSSTPTRSSVYTYNGLDLASETDYDLNAAMSAQTTYTYTSSASTTSGIPGHGSTNAGGPYLQSISRWNSSPSGSVVTSYTYNDTGAVLSAQDADSHPLTNFKYDSTFTYVTEVDKPDTTDSFGTTWHHITQTSYDFNSGAVLSTNDENSVANQDAYPVTYQYDAVGGRLSSINYPDGGQTSYSYASSVETDLVVKQSAATSITSAQILDSYGRPYQTISNGISAERGYDGNGRLFSVSTPHISGSSPTDGVTYYYYDTLDRVISVQEPDGTTVGGSYLGNTATTTDELGDQTKRTSNAFGELTKVIEPDPNTGTPDLETDYVRDGLGNITCVEQHGNVSGTGCSSSPSSDATSPWRVRRFWYNSLSQLRAASIPEHSSEPSHPPSQNCGTPDGSSGWTDCYLYDGDGNLIAATDNRSVVTSFSYDNIDREHIQSSPNLNNIYDYDSGVNGVGLLRLPSNNAGGAVNASSSYGYDVMGRVASIDMYRKNANGGLDDGKVTFGHDLAGNLTSITYPDGRVIQNNYDTSNRLGTVVYQSWNGSNVGTTYWSASSYAPPGELTGATMGGLQVQAAYNNRQDVGSLIYQNAQQTLFNKSYQWQANAANLIAQTDNLTSIQRVFTYDKLNRLTSAVDTAPNGTQATGSVTISGTEGSTVSCVTLPGHGTHCTTVPDSGQLTITVNGFSASVDSGSGSTSAALASSLASALNGSGSPVTASVNGSVISLVSIVRGNGADYSLSASNSGGSFSATASGATLTGGYTGDVPGGVNQQYALDSWGNLSSMGSSGFSEAINDQNQVSAYSYDAAGRLLSDGTSSYTYDDNNMLVTSSDGESYIYDAEGQRAIVDTSGGNVEEFYVAGSPIATYNQSTGAWTDLIYAGGERIAVVSGIEAATPSYAIIDQIGTEAATTDNNGNLLTSVNYAPWGQIASGATGSSYFFSGLQRDGTGLDHASARQYSSVTARWTVPDPYDGSYSINDPQSLNRYTYARNNPLAFEDPSGLQAGTINGDPVYSGGDECVVCDAFATLFVDIGELITGELFDSSHFTGNVNAQHQGLIPRVNADGSINVSNDAGDDGLGGASSSSSSGFVFGDPVFSTNNQHCPAGPANVYDFIHTHQDSANALAKTSGVSADYLLGLSGWESQWGANRFAMLGNNFFSLHGGAKAPFATGSMLATRPPYASLSMFPSYFASGQSFLAQYGTGLSQASDPTAFAQQLIKNHFNSGNAKTGGNPNFVANTVTGINMVIRRKGC